MSSIVKQFWIAFMAHRTRLRVVHVVGAILGVGLCGLVLLKEGTSATGKDIEKAKRTAFAYLEDWRNEVGR